MAALVVGAALARPAAVRAELDEDELPPGARITQIGPQAIVMEDANGHVRMVEDPAQEWRECDSTASCAMKALSTLGVFGVLTYEELTTNVEGSGHVAGPGGGE